MHPKHREAPNVEARFVSGATRTGKDRSRACRYTEARDLLDDDGREVIDMILGDHPDRIVGAALTEMVRNVDPDFPPVRRRTVNSHRLEDCSCEQA